MSMQERLIFLIGSPRSGSTLTARMLGAHSAIFAPPETHLLTPGKMITWEQNAPHRIENGPMLNVSLSVEFMTPAALMRANVVWANGLLRRRLGATPRLPDRVGPMEIAKVGLARAGKAAGLVKPNPRVLPPSFRLDAGRPGALLPA